MGYPMDERALSIVSRSHGVYGMLEGSVNGSPFSARFDIAGDSEVTVDGKSASRRKLKASVVADVTSPTVSPIQAEVRAWYVLVDDPSGREFPVPVGTFVVTSAVEASPGIVELTGEDRWRRVLDARFPRPVTTSGNTVAAITSLLTDADSRIEVVVDPGVNTSAVHRSSLWERDRDKAITELARSIGATVFFDPMGVAHIAPMPTVTGTPYWTIATGRGGARLGRRRGINRERTYNAVSVVGDPGNGAAPVYGFASDDAAGSVTKYGGPFGKRTRFYRSSLISTTAQADATARSLLGSVRGVASTMQLETLAHPGLDAGDVVSVEVSEGVFGRFLVAGFGLPLGLGSLTIDAATDLTDDDEGE